MTTYLPYIIGGIIAILVIILLATGYVKAPPDQAYIISGFKKKGRTLIGRAGVKIPFLEEFRRSLATAENTGWKIMPITCRL